MKTNNQQHANGYEMKLQPTPWTIDIWGKLKDAKGDSIVLDGVALSGGQEAQDQTRLLLVAPALLEVVRALVKARAMGFPAADILDENSPIMDGARDALRRLEP